MRILFGPAEDVLHIDPQEPNGYEWWYFDAISDDGQYALVAIYFLGSPMSPYYKAVVDGKNPLPKDWCGVFFTLHERTPRGYVERAYTYNLYTNNFRFGSEEPIILGNSVLAAFYNADKLSTGWQLQLSERNLWYGSTRAELRFDASFVWRDQTPLGDPQDHNWVCVAPHCGVQGTITLNTGDQITFHGTGYHDHNYGKLPWTDMSRWHWSRTHFDDASAIQGSVHYSWMVGSEVGGVFEALWDKGGKIRLYEPPANSSKITPPVLPVLQFLEENGIGDPEVVRRSALQSAPFYQRYVVRMEATSRNDETITGREIGEEFTPSGLAGPIMSKALWTRIRRRS